MYCSCTGHVFTVMSHLRERLVWNAWGLKERSTPALEEPGIVQWMFTFEQSERIEACLRRSGAVSSSSSRPSHTKEHLPCRSQTLTICAGKSGWGHGPFPKSFVNWLQVTNDSSPLLKNLCLQRYVLLCTLNAVTFCDMLWLYYAVLVWQLFNWSTAWSLPPVTSSNSCVFTLPRKFHGYTMLHYADQRLTCANSALDI